MKNTAKENTMKRNSHTLKLLLAMALVSALAPAVAVRAAFLDTFESFTIGGVGGQGSWGNSGDPAQAIVTNAAGIAFAGTQYVDVNFPPGPAGVDRSLIGHGLIDPLSYYMRFGNGTVSPGPDNAFVNMFWRTPADADNIAVLRLFGFGELDYQVPGVGFIAGPTLLSNTWYRFKQTYTAATGFVNVKVTKADDDSVALNVSFDTLVPGLVNNGIARWNFGTFETGAGFHVFLDNVSVQEELTIPEPTSLGLLGLGALLALHRRWRR